MSITSAALTSTHAVSPELSTVSLLLVGQAGGILGVTCFGDGRTLLRTGERLVDRGYGRVTSPEFETAVTPHHSKRASTNAAGSNGARSSGPSPRPTSLTGTPSS